MHRKFRQEIWQTWWQTLTVLGEPPPATETRKLEGRQGNQHACAARVPAAPVLDGLGVSPASREAGVRAAQQGREPRACVSGVPCWAGSTRCDRISQGQWRSGRSSPLTCRWCSSKSGPHPHDCGGGSSCCMSWSHSAALDQTSLPEHFFTFCKHLIPCVESFSA